MIATGGGGRNAFWRQMMADVLCCPIATVTNKGGTALGAAILAGVGVGIYENVQSACSSVLRTNEP